MTLTKIDDRGLKTPIDLLDNEKIRLGTGNDLEIYHNGSNSYIKEPNAVAGQFIIDGYNGTDTRQGATGEHMIRAIGGGSVELYHNGTKKFETTNTGITVTGGLTASGASTFNEDVALTGANYNVRWDKSGNTFEFDDNAEATFGTGTDLRIFHSNGYNYFRTGYSDSEIHIKDNSGNNIAKFKASGNNEFYYDGNKKLETSTNGATVTGQLTITDDLIVNDNIIMGDTDEIRLGDNHDLKIYHDGSNSYISDAGTGDLIITGTVIRPRTDQFTLTNAAANEVMIQGLADGAVSLYYDGSKKFDTVSGGTRIFGYLSMQGSGGHIYLPDSAELKVGNGEDLKIYHDGTHSYIYSDNGELKIRAAIWKAVNEANSEKMIEATENGSVDLYYDNSKKFETFSGGVRVHGELLMQNNSLYLNDNAKLRLGTGQDFNIFHDGTDNIFQSGGLHNFIFKPKDTDVGLKVIGDGGVELYFDNSKKFEVTASGVSITGNTIAVKPCKVIQNTNVTDTTGNRFQVDLPSTSRMFRLTGSFSFDGSNTYRIWGHLGGWSDSHTASLEGFANFWVDGASGDLEQDVTSGSYFEVADPVDSGNLEVTYDILITSMAHNGGARPGVSGNISWTYNGVGRAWTVFSYQDTAAAGTDRLLYFAWDIDNVSGDPGTGKHQYVLEEFPLTQ